MRQKDTAMILYYILFTGAFLTLISIIYPDNWLITWVESWTLTKGIIAIGALVAIFELPIIPMFAWGLGKVEDTIEEMTG